MNLHALRERLKEFLAEHIRIDDWSIDTPTSIDNSAKPRSSALDEPAQIPNEEGFLSGGGSPTPLMVSVTFPFQILYRFDAALRYRQLPRGILEAKLFWIRQVFRNCVADISDDIDQSSVRVTSTVAVARQESKDWILVCKIGFSFTIQMDREDLAVDDPRFDPVVS